VRSQRTTEPNVTQTPSAATREWLDRLIAFDTTSRNSNLELIDHVRRDLEQRGIACTLTHDETGTKANLDATIGPADTPGIALSGHTDVVPVDNQPWSSDPFAVTESGGAYYGRGTADMKGFLAVCLAQVPAMQAAALHTPIHLCLSYDEEVGCLGVRTLLADFARREVTPRAVIVGEPTSMRVVNGHKGNLSMRAHVHGRAGHSALAPQGVNALEYAARIVTFLSDMHRRKQAEGPFDPSFEIPHSTIHCGTFEAGTAQNIVPDSARFTLEFRTLPCEDVTALREALERYIRDEIEPAMQAVAPEARVHLERRAQFVGLDTDPEAAIITLAKALTGENALSKVSFGTEAGLFAAGGMPAVICGPGDIAQAHKADEFVTAAQLARCESFVERLIARLSDPATAPMTGP
jgi:acetylornithine deacetylase